MANIFDVAQYILHAQGKMSTWKMQNLCFYAQAWMLAWTGTPLFPEEFEAWSCGPVCYELRREVHGGFIIEDKQIKSGDMMNLTLREAENIDNVLEVYGDMKPYELVYCVKETPPWIDARGDSIEKIGETSGNIISKDAMKSYFVEHDIMEE